MAKQFLDASGLNQYTQALKNGTLIVGKAAEASHAATAEATGIIGIIPLENIPQGALEKLVKVANQTERFELTTNTVQNGDSVLQIDTNVMYIVVDDKKLKSEDGYVEYAAGTASKALNADFATNAGHANNADNASNAKEADHAYKADDASTAQVAYKVEWNNVANKPTEFKPDAHTHGAVDVSTLTGYTESTAEGDARNVAPADNLLTALGKLEKKADDAAAKAAKHTHKSNQIDGMTGYSKGESYSPIKETDTLNQAIGKLEKLAVDSSVWDGIGGKPTEFIPENHDAAKVVSLNTYSKTGEGTTGDIKKGDTLVQALAKLENKAEAGADERIPNDVIDSIVNGSYKPTA